MCSEILRNLKSFLLMSFELDIFLILSYSFLFLIKRLRAKTLQSIVCFLTFLIQIGYIVEMAKKIVQSVAIGFVVFVIRRFVLTPVDNLSDCLQRIIPFELVLKVFKV